MIRKIIEIDTEKCNGCGLCADACQEGAIAIVNGKARLLRDDYCDGLGNCLPVCPTDAISFVEREAAEYDEAAVEAQMAARGKSADRDAAQKHAQRKTADIDVAQESAQKKNADMDAIREPVHGKSADRDAAQESAHGKSADRDVVQERAVSVASWLRQWPVQIKLAPVQASYFDGADLLIAADCTAYAYGNFHQDFIRGRVTLIGCSKLDGVDYSEKLTEILKKNEIRSVKVVRMEVPCCGGILRAVEQAVKNSGKKIPVEVAVISVRGEILTGR